MSLEDRLPVSESYIEHLLNRDVVRLLGYPEMPRAFYRGMRLMALDGFTIDLSDTLGTTACALGCPGGSGPAS